MTSSNVSVVGPFDQPHLQASVHADLSSPIEAYLNGHGYNGFFFVGTVPTGGEAADGLGARYPVQTLVPCSYGYVGNSRQSARIQLWLK